MCPRSLSVRVAEARQDCGCRSLPGIELFPSSCNLAAVVTQANSCSYWGGGGQWSELSVHWLPKGQMRHKNSSSHVSLKWSVGVEDALKIHILTMAGQVLGGLSHP